MDLGKLELEDIENHLSQYVTPIRGIHWRKNDMIVEVIATEPCKNYAVLESDEVTHRVSRQRVFTLLGAAICEHKQKFPNTRTVLPLDSHHIAIIPSEMGKPGALEIEMWLDPIGYKQNYWLIKLEKEFNTLVFRLGFVPNHATAVKMLKNTNCVFNDGLLNSIIVTSKNTLRCKVDIPYIRQLNTKEPSLLLHEESVGDRQSKEWPVLDHSSLELD